MKSFHVCKRYGKSGSHRVTRIDHQLAPRLLALWAGVGIVAALPPHDGLAQTVKVIPFGVTSSNDTVSRLETQNVYGVANDMLVSGGTQNVFSGGVVNGASLSGMQGGVSGPFASITTFGIQNVSSGGLANSTTVGFHGSSVVNGGVASATLIVSGGEQQIVNGGSAFATEIDSGGTQFVSNGGIASNTTINGGTQTISIGFVTGTTINSGGGQTIAGAGGATSTTINSGGQQQVIGGSADAIAIAIAIATTIAGGVQTVSDGAIAVSTTINAGQQVLSNATASATTVNGGEQIVGSGSVASGTTVNGDGFSQRAFGRLTVQSGGQAVSTTVDGGLMIVTDGLVSATSVGGEGQLRLSGGQALDTVVDGGATVAVSDGGVASGTQINDRGELSIGHAVASDSVINAGGGEIVTAGGSSYNAWIKSGGIQRLVDGMADGTLIDNGGVQMLIEARATSGAVVNNTRIASGGQQIIEIGTASNTTIENGAVQTVEGGVASASTIESGGLMTVLSQGVAQGAWVEAGGTQVVSAGGNAISSTVRGDAAAGNSGQLIVAGGTALSAVVGGGGRLVVSSGLASATVLNQGGIQTIESGGSASSTQVNSGGIERVDGGTAIGTLIADGGLQQVDAGSTIATWVGSGGEQRLLGGVASDTTVVSAGLLSVSSGGHINTPTVLAGGTMNVYASGIATSGQVASSALLSVEAGGQAFGMTLEAGAALVTDTDALVTGQNANGTFRVRDKVASNVLLENGGLLTVRSGGSAQDTVVGSGGSLTVRDAGVANATVLGVGGAAVIDAGGHATGLSVTSSTVEINGVADDVIVHAGARVFGIGTVNTSLTMTSGSTLVANTPASGLTVNAPLSFASGSTYQVALMPAASAGVVTVNGALSIGAGTTLALNSVAGQYTPNTAYTILRYTGVESGSFSNVTHSFAYLAPVLSYAGGVVTVTLAVNVGGDDGNGGSGGNGGGLDLFQSVATNANQRSVGIALTNIYLIGGNALIALLLGASTAEARAFLTQESGDEMPAFRQMAEQRVEQAQSVLADRLGRAALQGSSAATPADRQARPLQDWWAQAGYQQNRQQGDERSGAGAYSDRSSSVFLGHDRVLTPQWRVGAALMLNHDTVSFDERSANARTNGAQALLYGSFTPLDSPLYLTGVLSYGWWNNTLSRQVALGPLSATPNGSFATSGESLYLETGLNWDTPVARIQPYVGAKAGRYQQQAYTEAVTNGPDLFNLHYDKAHNTATSSVLGVRLQAPGARLFGLPLDWQGDLSWQHRFGASTNTVNVAFTEEPDFRYRIAGTKADRDTFHATLGASWRIGRLTSLYINGTAMLGEKSHGYGGNGGIQWQW